MSAAKVRPRYQRKPRLVKVDHALHELNQELREKNLKSDGAVETIIVYDERHGRLNHLGRWVKPHFLTALNMNHATKGKRTTN